MSDYRVEVRVSGIVMYSYSGFSSLYDASIFAQWLITAGYRVDIVRGWD